MDTYAKTRPLTQRVFTVAEVNNFIAAFKQEVDRAVMDQSVRRQIFDGVIAAVPRMELMAEFPVGARPVTPTDQGPSQP